MRVLIILTLCAAVVLLERYSMIQPDEQLQVKAAFDEKLTEPGSEFGLNITVENHGWLPLFYLQLTFSIPRGLIPGDKEWAKTHCRETIGTTTVVETIFLMPHQRMILKVPMKAEHRGWFTLGNIFITTGDFFGLKTTITSRSQQADIVVMPPRMRMNDMPDAIGGFFGDVSARRWLFEDPVITAGYADYTGREPMKSIAWGQSARLNRLTVRQFDHTAENTVAVLLDMDNTDENSAEKCFSCARTVVEMLEDRHITWSFVSNGNLRSANGLQSSGSGGQGRVHYERIMEILGRANYGTSIAFEAVTERILHGVSSSSGYIVIVPEEGMKQNPEIRRLSALTGGMVYTVAAEGEIL